MGSDRELRVLQLCSSSAISGAETNVLSLSSELRQRGHFVQTVTPTEGWLPNALFEEEIPNHIMGMRNFGWWRTVGYCCRQIRRNQIDVVHTHLTRAAYIGRMIGILSRRPVITSVHIANNDTIYKKLAFRQNRLIAVSDFVAGMLYGLGVPDRYVETVYNGTNLADFTDTNPFLTKKSLGIDPDKTVIGVVGKVCAEKGHLELLQAMSQLIRKFPSVHLLLVGKVTEEFASTFYAELQALRLREFVTLTGERYDVPALIDAIDISAMPSHMETFGVSALEAMARGKAVVATRVGGLPEIVRDGHTGVLVEPSSQSLAEGLSYLLEREDMRHAMGERGRRMVQEKFTLKQMTDSFESVYRRAIG
jgi:glycosyltransferase involved in cell wall biosynthesis